MLHDDDYKYPNQRKPDVSHDLHELVLPLSEYGVRVFYYIKEYEEKKDSSNMDSEDWVEIAKDVRDNYDAFDSFVILHGTDTMSYTASILSFMFQNLHKTVILTGSQISLFEQRNDGRNNVLGALMFAGHFVIPEVTLFFHGKLYRGNRTTKINSGDFLAFDSPNLAPLATIGAEINVRWDVIWRCDPNKKFTVHTELNLDVGVLKLFPGITDNTVESICREPVKGIVLESFGAGNCPNERKEFIEILEKAIKRGAIIFNCTQCLKGGVKKDFETGKILFDIGVLSGSDITTEAALTKLSYVLSKDLPLDKKKELMETSIRGELSVASTSKSGFIKAIASDMDSTPDNNDVSKLLLNGTSHHKDNENGAAH
ncbi:L-asparaginase-like isoform X2 [Xenia sp. Carnegie-2017]|nr:L-asparaginase-like isoform X2 [Xenia sp. Carnegie-2017]